MSSQPSVAKKQQQQKKKVCAGCGKEEAAGLVVLKNCSGCHSVIYCSSDCQRAGWPGHKEDCKLVQLSVGVGSAAPTSASSHSSSTARRYHSWDAFNACVQNHYEELQKVLLQARLDVNWAEPSGGATALHVAASQGHDKCLEILRDAGANLNASDLV